MSDHLDIEKLPAEIDGIPVRETIREIFRNPKNGAPDNISKAGCLALALKSNEMGEPGKGYVVWNAWRENFPVRPLSENVAILGLRLANTANFSEIGTSENPININFSKFLFGDQSNFSKNYFGGFQAFAGAIFGEDANFSNANFGIQANFKGAIFSSKATFNSSIWGWGASFFGAQIGPHSSFDMCNWHDLVNFSACQFGKSCSFKQARFYDDHEDRDGLPYIREQPAATFEGAEWDELLGLYSEDFEKRKSLSVQWGAPPNSFLYLIFDDAIFFGSVTFKNRIFKNGASFKNAKFNKTAPLFFGSRLHQDTSFEGAKLPDPTGSDEAARAYCTLKAAFSEHQADGEVQRFFRLEQAEKAASYAIKTKPLLILPWWLLGGYGKQDYCHSFVQFLYAIRDLFIWLLYKFYAWTSNYGFSVIKPLLFWLALAAISSGLYIETPYKETCFLLTQNCSWDSKAFGQSLFQAVPFGGLPELKNDTYECWLAAGIVLHKAFSLVLLFLAGLALRNLFKLK